MRWLKTILHEIQAGYLRAAGAALLALTLASILAAPRWVLGLALTDSQVCYIRAVLAFCGIGLLALIGWLLFFRTRRKLLMLQQEFAEARDSPQRFQDDLGASELSILRLAHQAYPERYTRGGIGKKLNLAEVDLAYSLQVLVAGGFLKSPTGGLHYEGHPDPDGYAITTRGIEAVRRNKN